MALYRLLLQSIRRPSTFTSAQSLSHFLNLTPSSVENPNLNPQTLIIHRSFAFSSAEEAAAERRRRKRRLRIEPPLHALRAQPHSPPVRDPNAPRLPDSTSQLTGQRLNLHNRVQSLIRASDLDAASLLARSAVFSNTRPTVFTCNAIIAAMYRNQRFDEAIALFHYFFKQSNIVPNVVSYNNLINTHCDRGEVDTALDVYREILTIAPFSPSPITYRHLTKGLIDAERIGEAVDLLREMLNKGHGADSLVFNNLISGFLNLGNLEKANELFDELKERCLVYDGIVNATFMEWWFNQGKAREAMDSYRSYMDREFRLIPATCNVLLEVLIKHGRKTEAWALFERMLDDHKPPNTQAVNSETFNIMVNECFKLGKFEEAIQTFKKVGTKVGSKAFSMDVGGYCNIITRFCEHRMLSEADVLFKELLGKSLSPDVPTYRTLVDAYLKAERVDDALKIFSNMVEVGLRVVAGFGTRVFSELIKNGKCKESAELLTKMGEKDPKPDASIYDVVVRGLCDAGELDKSREIVVQMMRYGVGVTPTLQVYVREVFGGAGRSEEIEAALNETRVAPPRPSGPPRNQPWGQQQQQQQQSHGQFPRNQMATPHGPGPSQMPAQHSFGGYQQSSPSQFAGQQQQQQQQYMRQQPPMHAQYPEQQTPMHAQFSGQQPQVNSQFSGQQPQVNSQFSGQQPHVNSQFSGQQQWGSTQTATQTAGQQSWNSPAQTAAGQQSWNSPQMAQTAAGQHSWNSSQIPTQTSWDSQQSGQQNHGSSHYTGPKSIRLGQMEGYHRSGQQQHSWSPQPSQAQAQAPQERMQDQSAAHDWYETQQRAAAASK